MTGTLEQKRKRLYQIVEVGAAGDFWSRAYDWFYVILIIVNLTSTIAFTFDRAEDACGALLHTIEAVSAGIFGLDYIARLFTAKYKYPKKLPKKAVWAYALSFMGLIDLISFLPYFLPMFFPSGAAAFRLFRIIRIFRLFRINAYYDSLNVITEVLSAKKQQLLSSVFIILILMIFSSLCMYSLENEAQPEVFQNAFSGIWWAVSTLLTVGYGDIYPITIWGRILGIVITFLGVGMVAIPTGIISAGFVDQYSRAKRMSDYGRESDIHFIRIPVQSGDKAVGTRIRDLSLPKSVIIAAINRDGKILVPRGNMAIEADDVLVLGAESLGDDRLIELKEVVLTERNPWVGMKISQLDISRQTLIVFVRRDGQSIIPNGNTVLQTGDVVILYTQNRMSDSVSIRI